MKEGETISKPALTIADSPARRRLDGLIGSNIEKIAQIESIETVETLSTDDKLYRCAEFVFGHMRKEDWCERQAPHDLWKDTLAFLQDKGYAAVQTAQDGDIVGYASDNPYDSIPEPFKDDTAVLTAASLTERKPPFFGHFGIYNKGRVISKLGNAFAYEHPLDMVPTIYGSNVYFF